MPTHIKRDFPSRSTRTPIFQSLRRLFALARLSQEAHRPPSDELIEMPIRSRGSRREFLQHSGAMVAAAGLSLGLSGCMTPRTGPNAPRIAIVGGGIAGLNAAYKLRKRGWSSTIFEGSQRTGGRMFSARGLLAPGLTTELGGEFVDSNHKEMFALAKEFGLPWLDMNAPSEAKLTREAYYFGGQHHSEAQVVEALRSVAPRIQADFDKLGDVIDFEHEGGAGELDRLSLSTYFDRLGAQGWIRKLLDVAFLTEFGLETSEQSALNMILMISTDLTAGQVELFGESDERFKVVGGNQRIVDALAGRLRDRIRTEHKLVAIKQRDREYTLVFELKNGRLAEIMADLVILTLPFTTLREVDLRIGLPEWKTRAIRELGYGMNAKLMLGFHRRVWRDQGQSGNIFSDESFQLAWDNSRLQGGEAGGLTCYSGGRASDALKQGTPSEQAARMLPALDQPFPGVKERFNQRAERFHWPTHPFTKASYACYKPGQWTTIAGAEIKSVGNLFFAGEHCSVDFQGFMNGGAETGKQAALDVLRALRGWKPVPSLR